MLDSLWDDVVLRKHASWNNYKYIFCFVYLWFCPACAWQDVSKVVLREIGYDMDEVLKLISGELYFKKAEFPHNLRTSEKTSMLTNPHFDCHFDQWFYTLYFISLL